MTRSNKNVLRTVLVTTFIVFLTANGLSGGPTHPLSDITPMDVPLQLDGQPIQSGEADDIVINETENMVVDTDIWMEDSDIQNFFGVCEGSEAVTTINEDGSFECIDMMGGEVSDAYVNRSGDSMTGDLDMDGNIVTGLGMPTEDGDAVRLQYLETEVSEATQDLEDVLTLGNEAFNEIDMTGETIYNIGDLGGTDIVGSSNIESNSVHLDELNEGSVDSRYVEVGGDTMDGNLDMSDNMVTGLRMPFDDYDAVRLSYLESEVEEATQDLENVLTQGYWAEGQDIDMGGGDVLDIGDLTGSGIVNEDQISGGAVGLDELDTGDVDSRYVEVGGDTMEGDLDMSGGIVTGLGMPDDDYDAVRRRFLEGEVEDATQNLEQVLAENNQAGNYDIHMSEQDITGIGTLVPDGQLEVDGDIQINDGDATGTDSIEGSRELYAGDEIYVTGDGGSIEKEVTLVFNEEYGKNPSYVNVLARGEDITVEFVDEGMSETLNPGDSIGEVTFDTSGLDEGTYEVNVDVGDGGWNDLIEFYYVE